MNKNFDDKGFKSLTFLLSGGVFFAAAEPIAHYLSVPPLYGDAEPKQKAINV